MSSPPINRNPPPPTSEPPAPPEESPPDEPEAEPRTFRFPSAFTVLTIVAVAVWGIAMIIPAGQYDQKDGSPVPGTYHKVPSPMDFHERVNDLLLSPVNGLYGIQDAETGVVSASAVGELFGAAQVFLFVLAIGSFITVMFATGALDRGIARLAYRTRDRGWLMIVAVMSVFSLLGSVEGMAEETLGFYGLIVPLMLALGYDRMVAAATILVGAGVGVIGSTVNPFSIGIASGFADTSIGDGIALRFVIWIVLTGVAIAYVMRYAQQVKSDPAASLVGFRPGDREAAVAATAQEPAPLTARHKIVLWAVGLTFAFMIFAIIPWSGILSGPDADPYSWELGWWFPELTVLFLVAAVLLGMFGGLGENRLTTTIAKGAGDFIYPALVIVLARGVTVIMTNAQITDTVLHSMEKAASGAASGVVRDRHLPREPAARVPDSLVVRPRHAGDADPRPAGGLRRGATMTSSVTAWNAASGWMNLWIPTTAVVMGGIALAKVGYDKYLRFLAPLLGIFFVLICAFLAIGAVLS